MLKALKMAVWGVDLWRWCDAWWDGYALGDRIGPSGAKGRLGLGVAGFYKGGHMSLDY